MRSYERITKAVSESLWAIQPQVLKVILDVLAYRAGGGKLSEEEIQARIGSSVERAEARVAGGVAIVPLHGPIFPKAELMTEVSGATSLATFRAQFREALANDDVTAIVIDIDSPGGVVDMVPETAEEIRAARGGKRIVAVANTLAASAAYFIGSQADELVMSPSGQVGSIGVWTAHEDWSKHDEAFGVKTTLVSAGKFKTEGNPFEPLDDEAREAMQGRVDEWYGMFVAAVAKGRGTTARAVRAGFGQGRVVLSKEALAESMVDRVATLDDTVDRLGGSVAAVPLVKNEPSPLTQPGDDEPVASQPKPIRSDAFVRSLPVEDIAVRSDGRTVEAYAAVFDTPARVTDWYYLKDNPYDDEFGTYNELLRSRVFEKSLKERGRDFQVMFNHGRDVFGRPLERFAMPLAVPVEVRADGRGLVTVSRYAKTELADEVLELIREGAIRAMSFSGRPMQTKVIRGRGGEPDTLERLEIALREFGPAIFPVYNGAEIVGVRAAILQGTPYQAAQLGTEGEPSGNTDTSSEAGDQPPPKSGPSTALLLLQQEQRRRSAGI